jgi:hypothetical protein
MPQEGVPRRNPRTIGDSGNVYRERQHLLVYVPAQYDPATGQPDGFRTGRRSRTRMAICGRERDGQSIYRREIPVMIGLHQSGPASGSGRTSPQTGWGDGTTNRASSTTRPTTNTLA